MATVNLTTSNGNEKNAPLSVTVLACLFMVFCYGMVLPMLFAFGTPFMTQANIELPSMTSLFAALSPWPSIAIAMLSSAFLIGLRIKTKNLVSERVNWIAILATGIITLLGVVAFLAPIVAVMSGLQG
jgi:hypothetical protein